MKNYGTFAINYFQDKDCVFTALCPQIKGCIASRKTLEEAYRNMIDAIDSCIEARSFILNSLSAKSNSYS